MTALEVEIDPTLDTSSQVRRYCAVVYEPDDVVEVRAIDTSLPKEKQAIKRWYAAQKLSALPGLNGWNIAGRNIYVGVAARVAHGKSGNAAFLLCRVIFADFDDVALDEVEARIRKPGLPEPTMVIASGHGVHAYWKLDEPITDSAVWRRWQRSLARLLGSDESMEDPDQIIRLPGYLNTKHQPYVACRIVRMDASLVYPLERLGELIPLLDEEQEVHEHAAPVGDCINAGDRHPALISLGGSMRRRGMSAAEIDAALQVVNAQRCNPPLDADEVTRIAECAAKYEPKDDVAKLVTAEVLGGRLLMPAFKSARQLLADHPHLRRPVIHGLLRQGETMNVIAPSKTGKSWLVNDLGLSLSSGLPWLGRYVVEQGDVLILDNELHGETTANRLPRVANARGLGAEQWVDRLHVENMRGCWADVFKLRPYFDAIEPGRFRVIILDAFYRFLPPETDENDNGTVAGIYNQLDKYAARLECGFVLIHHSSKGSQAEKAVTDVGAGAGAQSRAADTHLILRAHEEPDVVVMDAATRSWPPIEPVCLRWSFPLWAIDDSLDPTQLRKSGRARRRESQATDAALPDPAKPVWDVARFVSTFLTDAPQAKSLVAAKARDAGIPNRRLEDLIALAQADGQVFKWSYEKDKVVYLSNRRQTLLETSSPTLGTDVCHTHAHPPHPPGVRKRTPGRGVARGSKGTPKPPSRLPENEPRAEKEADHE